MTQAVAGLECVFKDGFVTCRFSLGNPQHAHSVDKLRIALVKTTSDFSIYVLGKNLKRLGVLVAGFNCVDKFPARGKLLARGGG